MTYGNYYLYPGAYHVYPSRYRRHRRHCDWDPLYCDNTGCYLRRRCPCRDCCRCCC